MSASTFEFRPGPLRRPIRVEVAGSLVSVFDADGAAQREVDLTYADDASFAELGARDTISRWLDVDHTGGRLRVGCNSLLPEGPHEPDRDEFLAAASAILLALERHAPEVSVTVGTRGGARWAMFAMGATALAVGVGLPVAALVVGVPNDKFLAGLLPSALLVLIGLFLAAAHPPWRPAPRMPAGDLARSLIESRGTAAPSSASDAGPGGDVEGV